MKTSKKNLTSFAAEAIVNTKSLVGGAGNKPGNKHPGDFLGNRHPQHPGYQGGGAEPR